MGSVTARELAYRGTKVIGVADIDGYYLRREGFDIEKLAKHVEKRRTLSGFNGINKDKVSREEFFAAKCDIVVPAAAEMAIDGDMARNLKCRILAEAANGPCTSEADAFLRQHEREIMTIPDILCNAGGVIVSYFEWVQGIQMYFWTAEEVDSRLQQLIRRAFLLTHSYARKHQIDMRSAALVLGIRKVGNEKATRGLYP